MPAMVSARLLSLKLGYLLKLNQPSFHSVCSRSQESINFPHHDPTMDGRSRFSVHGDWRLTFILSSFCFSQTVSSCRVTNGKKASINAE